MTPDDHQLDLFAAEPAADDTLPDAEARHRITTDLDSTLFVEAGAGSGKTRALVERIVSLVAAGEELAGIAAITFTEKAAAELRARLRLALAAAATATPDGPFDRALAQLDAAPIATLHAFAQRLLTDHPIEARLPPGVEVLDELASQIDFDERWSEFLAELVDDPADAALLLLADALRIGPDALRALTRQLEDNWDLVATRLPLALGPLPPIDVGPTLATLRRVAACRAEALDADDKLAQRLAELDTYADELALADASEPDFRLHDLAATLLADDRPKCSGTNGAYTNLGRAGAWPKGRCQEARDELHEAGEALDRLARALTEVCLERLGARLGAFVLDAAERRRREGRLRFHDLLVLARELLTDPAVRRAARTRYRRLLIDEFQDTDPIQVDLAVLLGAADPDAELTDWRATPLEPGRLFFVGDPKQSIYRFRRADIATYLAAQDILGAGGQLGLIANFRSSPPVIDWVNRVFGRLIQETPGSQPRYLGLHAQAPAAATGPGVAVLGAAPVSAAELGGGKALAEPLRRREAALVVEAIRTALSEGWTVATREGGRPARLGDICILLPARTSLRVLEQALEGAGIPYRAETANLVFASPEIRELLLVARAVDDPTDHLVAVSALRTPAFGCGDDDLFTFRQAGGSFDHQRPPPEALGAEHPVVAGLAWMAELHDARHWCTPSEILDRIIRDRHLFEIGVLEHRHREVWRRLRFVVDQARAWTDATGGTLREFLRWARLQGAETSRAMETVLPETDTDAVRILTIHGAKGLEFPITIVSGLTTEPRNPTAGPQVVWPPTGPPGYRISAAVTTTAFDDFAPLDEQMDLHERLRLLYVACTRAEDHLVVSLVREPPRANGTTKPTSAQLLADAGGLTDVTEITLGAPTGARVGADAPADPTAPSPPPLPAWQERRAAAIAAATRTTSVAATTLARELVDEAVTRAADDPGLAKEPRDLDLPPWLKGRYGSALGRAVHGVLQSVDLGSGAGLDALAAGQAAAEGLLGHEAAVAALARRALASEIVQAAAAAPHWRELFVAAPVGERLLEGYIDLAYRSAAGIVIVDHKTDAFVDVAELDAKVDHYRIQLAAYAIALEAATNEPVARCVLLFLGGPDAAVARDVPDLAGARREVTSRLPAAVAVDTGGPD